MTGFINSFFTRLANAFSWLLDGCLELVKYGLFLLFDGLLAIFEGLIAAIQFPGLVFTQSAIWAGMPPQLVYILNEIGFAQCLSMVALAYSIRLGLNLIPSWATRV